MNKNTIIAISICIVTTLFVVSYVNATTNPSLVIIDHFTQGSDILPSSTSQTVAFLTIDPNISPKPHSVPDFSVWFAQSILIAVSIFVVVFWRKLRNQ